MTKDWGLWYNKRSGPKKSVLSRPRKWKKAKDITPRENFQVFFLKLHKIYTSWNRKSAKNYTTSKRKSQVENAKIHKKHIIPTTEGPRILYHTHHKKSRIFLIFTRFSQKIHKTSTFFSAGGFGRGRLPCRIRRNAITLGLYGEKTLTFLFQEKGKNISLFLLKNTLLSPQRSLCLS